MNREFAQRTEVLLASMMPGLRDAERPIVATVVVETISAMLIFANRKSAKVAQQVMDQTKVLLRRYLKPYERRGRVPGSPYPIRRER